jgi:hypothetical protein
MVKTKWKASGNMQYVTPFDVIKRDLKLLATQGAVRVNVTYDDFLSVVRRLLAVAAVDEAWYCATYPDVAQAIADGVHKSAKEHFVSHGYFEGRFPYDMAVDEAWYLRTYPDVAEGIKRGDHLSAAEHFKTNGYLEGRLPASPEAATASGRATAISGREQSVPVLREVGTERKLSVQPLSR